MTSEAELVVEPFEIIMRQMIMPGGRGGTSLRLRDSPREDAARKNTTETRKGKKITMAATHQRQQRYLYSAVYVKLLLLPPRAQKREEKKRSLSREAGGLNPGLMKKVPGVELPCSSAGQRNPYRSVRNKQFHLHAATSFPRRDPQSRKKVQCSIKCSPSHTDPPLVSFF